MKLFVGLGNPGAEYAQTRHNIGFMAIDEIADRHGFPAFKSKYQGLMSEGRLGGERVLLLKPQTFMNNSGKSVAEAARFYKVPVEDLFVFYDELDLAPGKLRTKQGGGNGGHNGLRSIEQFLPKDYWRIRLGIGHPGHKDRVTGHVLGRFSEAERDWLVPLLDNVARAADSLLGGDKNLLVTRVSQALAPARPQKAATDKPKKQQRPSDEIKTVSQTTLNNAAEPADAPKNALAAALLNAVKGKK